MQPQPKHASVSVYRHTPVQMLAYSWHFRFQETSVSCTETNGYLFNCYPQMRKSPSSSPHDDFPSKASSGLQLRSHSPLTLSPSVFLTFCPSALHLLLHLLRSTHTHMNTHRLSGYPVGRGLWILLTTAMFRSSLLCFALDFSPAPNFNSHTQRDRARRWLIGHK